MLPLTTYGITMDPMHLYLRAIYCFYLYDLEMLYTPDTILIALKDPLKDPPLGELLVQD